MSGEKQNHETQAEDYHLPAWFVDALNISRSFALFRDVDAESEQVAAAFRQRCHDAADVALTMAKLRKERQRVGFVPLSFADYVQGLVRVAGVSLSSLLAWLGIADVSQTDAGSARALARLAREIGLNLREALAHARIGFAGRIDPAPIPVLVAHRRGGTTARNPLDECEAVLRELESEYDAEALSELRRIESEVCAAFETDEQFPV